MRSPAEPLLPCYEMLTVIHKVIRICLSLCLAIFLKFMNGQELWEKALSLLKREISDAAFKTWFTKTTLQKIDDRQFVIVCSNTFAKTKIESIYKENILKIFLALTNIEPQLSVTVAKEAQISEDRDRNNGPLFKSLEKPMSPPQAAARHLNLANLSPHYTLESFVVGSNNRLAYAMASAVAKSPGANTNNPFFLYAPVGLGKTHLVQAIGNSVIGNFPSLRVLYTTSENFTNELIGSIQHRTQDSFRRKFRDVDVLIIDDIQFLAGRESTQEEFFHTFNALHLSQKQVILTSDRHPKEITRLEERLTSRFGGGIMSDIQNPDFETRLAILQTKTENLNLKIDVEILKALATYIQTNIRELEGGLKQTINLMLSQNGEVTVNDIRGLFQDRYRPQNSKTEDPKKIILLVCNYFGVKEGELLGKRRTQSLVRPRQIAMFLLRMVCELPLVKVGELLGGRDHTTVMHGVDKIEREIKESPSMQQDIALLQKQMENRP